MASDSANDGPKEHRTVNLFERQWKELERRARDEGEGRNISAYLRIVVDRGLALGRS